MASTESLGLMLSTIEIMKERLTASGLSPITLALTNCRSMPYIASRSATPKASDISRSPCSGSGWSMAMPRDESFIRGAHGRRGFDWSRRLPLSCRGLELCSRRYLLGPRASRTRFRQRAGDHSLRRAGATSMMGRVFACNRAEPPVVGQGDGRFYKLRDDLNRAPDLPDVSNCFSG